MVRRNDNSYTCKDWTNAKLLREVRRSANLEHFGGYLVPGYVGQGFPDPDNKDADAIREATRIYRQHMNYVFEEIERRFVK